MISLINITIFILWFLSAFADYTDHTFIFQLKEYRWDRFRDFLSTKQGKNYLLRYNFFWRSLFVILILFWPINEIIYVKYVLITIFSIDLLYNLYKIIIKKFYRPNFTYKATLIIGLAIFLEGLLFVLKRDWMALIILLLVRFLLISLIVKIINLLSNLIKKYFIKKATQKIQKYNNLIVIGITGSYGKTSIKKFLTQILSVKYKVISTPKNINTEIGIAQFILKNDFSDQDIFIVEMGAYKKGEIKLICDMVNPKIGILSAINEQHLSLFGDIKTTQNTKYELLRSLPVDGLAVINMDNNYTREFINELNTNVQTFGLNSENNPTCLIKDIQANLDGLHCKGLINGKEYNVQTNLIGEFNVMNIAPCVLVAIFLGLNLEEIRKQIKTLPNNLELFEYGNCKIINDSYNSNPDGFKAVLDILNKFPSDKKRIIITRGMLELGKESENLHKNIIEEISFIADELVVITPDFFKLFKENALKKYRINIIEKFEHQDLLNYIKNIKNKNCVILLENRIPQIVMDELRNNKK